MLRDVKAYTKASSTCQRICLVQHRPHGTMELLPHSRGPWTDISKDFIVGLPQSHRQPRGSLYNAILVVANRYTKIV
jgi:hypothetical protein